MGYSTQQAGQSQAGLDPQAQQAALAAMAAEDEGWAQQNQLSAARQAEQEAGLNEMDRQSDDFVKARGTGQSSTRTQTEVLAGERGLEAVAKRLYGEQWRAGLALLIQENKLKANQWGSPLIQEGQALQAPELNVSEETLAKLDRLGGQVIANNSKGLAARAELQRMQAEQQRLQAERAAAAQWDGGAGGGRGFVHPSADVNPYAQTTANANPTGGFAGRNQALTEAEQSLNQYYEGQRDGSFLGDLKARGGQLFGGTGYNMAKGANALGSLFTDSEFRAQVGEVVAKVVDNPNIVKDAIKKEWNEFKEMPWEEQLTTGGKVLLETVASAGLGKVANTAARRGVDLMGTELKALSEALSTGKSAAPSLREAAAKVDLPSVGTVGDEAFQQVYKLAPAAKLEVDELAGAIAKKYDADLATAPVKSAERAWQKVVNDYDGDASRIKDLARNTIIASEADIPRIVDDLAAAGAKVKVIDAADNALGYSGINASIKTKAGIHAEIQVNTPAMIFAKESPEIAERLLGAARYAEIAKQADVPGGLGHKLYEQHRVLDKASDAAQAIASQSRQYYDAVRGRVGSVDGLADTAATNKSYGVAFFGDSNLGYYTRNGATIGRSGKSFFMMPLEDSALVKDAADAARYTGRAPSAESAYLNGGDIYGLSFRTDGMTITRPTATDAGGWPHFLEGGNTAVRLGDGPSAGYLVNPTREFVIPGGKQVPSGSVLFHLGPNGEWIPMRRF